MNEKRLTQRLTNYWNLLKKEDPLPSFQKFNASAIDDVWDNCMLIAVNDNNPSKVSYSYYRLGDKVRKLYKDDVTGAPIHTHVKSSQGAGIIKRVDEVLSKHEPLYDNGQFVNALRQLLDPHIFVEVR